MKINGSLQQEIVSVKLSVVITEMPQIKIKERK